MVGWQRSDDDLGPMEGDAVEFEIRLRNGGLLPSMFMALDYNCGPRATESDRERLFVAWLGRHSSLTSRTKVRFGRRGLHTLAPVRAETSVPFGLFRRSRRLGAPTELLVLPRVYPMRRLGILGSTESSEPRMLRARIGEQITGSRIYAPGDPWQHIHWPNTARTAEPQVKEWERTSDDSLVIAFDSSRPQLEDDDALDHAVRVAASVGDFVCRSGGTVRLLTGRLDEETSSRQHLLRQLALLEAGGGPELSAVLRENPPTADLLAVVLESDASSLAALAELAGRRHRVVAVVLRGFEDGPAEQLPDTGVVFVDCWREDIPGAISALELAAGTVEAGHRATGR